MTLQFIYTRSCCNEHKNMKCRQQNRAQGGFDDSLVMWLVERNLSLLNWHPMTVDLPILL